MVVYVYELNGGLPERLDEFSGCCIDFSRGIISLCDEPLVFSAVKLFVLNKVLIHSASWLVMSYNNIRRNKK